MRPAWWLAAVLLLMHAPLQARDDDGAARTAAIDAAWRRASVRPQEAVEALGELARQGSDAERALALWAQGNVLHDRHEEQRVQQLAARLERGAVPSLRAAGELLLARRLLDGGASDSAAQHARAALTALDGSGGFDPASEALRGDALRLLGRLSGSSGDLPTGLHQLHAASHLAAAHQDPWRQAAALQEQALLLAGYHHDAQAAAVLDAAFKLIEPQRDATALASLQLSAAQLALARHDLGAARRACASAIELAQLAQARGLETRALTQQAEVLRRAGEAAAALQSAQAALALSEAAPAHELRRLAQAQLGLAQVRLGQVAAGRRAVEQAVKQDRYATRSLELATPMLLRQLDEALSSAGDARAAIEVYHRERGLQQALLRRDGEAALRDLQASYDSERKQREIDLLNRDNALKAASLEAQTLQQRMLWLAALVLGLALVLTALLYRRVHAAHRALAASQSLLRTQSESDALTGLANRRHFQARMQALDAQHGFEGALFLIDIDHFKHINDEHGHPVGDAVLVEVSRRIAQMVRGGDLAVRWGGEEFLVAAPSLPPEQAPTLAVRLLHALRDAPVQLPLREGRQPLPVTASIGYAHFPLPPHLRPMSWERAINLADMALYIAKHQGRNRACGIAALNAPDDAALRAIEADVEQAWHDGRAVLRLSA